VEGGADLHSLGSSWRLGAPARSGPATQRGARHPRPPESGRRWKKGGTNSEERDCREALGRSRGGYDTNACVIADGHGRAVAFALAPGQAHELPMAPRLLDCLPDVPGWVVGDRGFAFDAFPRPHLGHRRPPGDPGQAH
jgi:hypothetical protein